MRIGECASAELALTAPFIYCEGAFRHLILHVKPCPPPSTISKAAFQTASLLFNAVVVSHQIPAPMLDTSHTANSNLDEAILG